jgi:hypothetical protein
MTLRSLEAKAARLMLLAARQGCAMVNLSTGPSRLVFPRAGAGWPGRGPGPLRAVRRWSNERWLCEAGLGYLVPSGRYWEEADRFDTGANWTGWIRDVA